MRAGTPLVQKIHFALLQSLLCPVKPGEGVRQEEARQSIENTALWHILQVIFQF